MSVFDGILEAKPVLPFNPVDNYLNDTKFFETAKSLFFEGDVKLLEKIESKQTSDDINEGEVLARPARSSVIPYDHDIQLGVGELLGYPHVFDPIFLLTLTKMAHFQGLVINPNTYRRYQSKIRADLRDVTIIAKLNDASRLVDPKFVAPKFASVDDAVEISANFVGWSYYFSPNPEIYKRNTNEMYEIIQEAKKKGVLSVVWAYPNGLGVSGHPYLGKESAPMLLNAAKHALNAGAFAVKVFYPDNCPNIPDKILGGKQEMDAEGYKRKLTSAEKAMLKGFANTKATGTQALAYLCKVIAGGAPIYTAGGAAEKGSDAIVNLAEKTMKAGATGNFVGRKVFVHSTPEEYWEAVHAYWAEIDKSFSGRKQISKLLEDEKGEFIKRIGDAMHYKTK